MIGHILQLNENKLTLQLLGQIMNMAEKAGLLSESDFMTLSEREVMERLDDHAKHDSHTKLDRHGELVSASITSSEQRFRNKFGMTSEDDKLCRYYKTFRTMTKIEHTNEALLENEYFCVNLKVKQRYINPLVVAQNSAVVSTDSTNVKSVRLSDISEKARRIIEDFKSYSDTPYGCVKLL